MSRTSTSRMEASTNDDMDMLSSTPAPTSAQDTTLESIEEQCTIFQSRIDSYKHELNHIQAENADIHHKLNAHKQEDSRDRLIDNASPEPMVVKQQDMEEMSMREVNERRKQLRCRLDQIQKEMDALMLEMDNAMKVVETYLQ